MNKIVYGKGWTTNDEINALKYMASGKLRKDIRSRPIVPERIEALKTWLSFVGIRRWDKAVNVNKCITKAKTLISDLENNLL